MNLEGKLGGADVRRYAMAGNARFTIRNVATGGRFTYRVRAHATAPILFVSVLSGPENDGDYSYIGFVRNGLFFHGGAKSRAKENAPSVVAFGWFWRNADRLPPQ